MNENEFRRLIRRGVISFKIEPYIVIESENSDLVFEAKGDVKLKFSAIEMFRNNKEEIIEIFNKEDFKEILEELRKEYKELRKQR